jgi:YidC/Oxa1 family membrane protein insertase
VTQLSKAIGWLLAVLYTFVPNLGIAIILLTCIVMLVLFPLTAKQTRSMIAMQRVQPEIKKIQAKYKDDRQKQNEEIMKFYQENKINPLSGCFPLLMQFPVFIALFALLRHMSGRIPKTGRFNSLYTEICPHATAANHYACPHPVGLKFLGMDLSVSPAHSSSVTSGFLGTLPYFIMVALVILTGWYQARQTMTRQQQSGPMNAQTQMIGKVMPVAIGLISLNFAAGLLVYYVTSNVWRIGQQQLVLNKIYDQAHAAPAPKANLGDSEEEPKPATEKTPPSKAAQNEPRAQGRAMPGSTAGSGGTPRARPNPNTAQRRKKKRKR